MGGTNHLYHFVYNLNIRRVVLPKNLKYITDMKLKDISLILYRTPFEDFWSFLKQNDQLEKINIDFQGLERNLINQLLKNL